MTRRRKFGLLISFAVIAGIGLWGVLGKNAFAPVMERYKVLSDVPWNPPAAYLSWEPQVPYAWIDNQTIAYLQERENLPAQLMRQEVEQGKVSPAKPIATMPTGGQYRLQTASPDGKWVVVESLTPETPFRSGVYATDGSGLKQGYDEALFPYTWLSDSSGFILMGSTVGELLLFNPDSPKPSTITTSYKGRLCLIISPKREWFQLVKSSQFATTGILQHGTFTPKKYQSTPYAPPMTSISVELVSVSPQGDKLLWIATRSEAPMMAKIKAAVTRTFASQNTILDWYITDTQGKHPRTLFSANVFGTSNTGTNDWAVNPQWLPNGTHLSLVHNRSLYVLPLPK